MDSGTILFARPLRTDGHSDLILDATFLSDDDIQLLDDARDSFLGPPEDMTTEKPRVDPNDHTRLIGGTRFERLGQHSVKDSGRCYSLSMTHQRQRALVGPTSGGKVIDAPEDHNNNPDKSANIEIRRNIIKVSMASMFTCI